MSFCTYCGAGFKFVGEHRPGCTALQPMPSAPVGEPSDRESIAAYLEHISSVQVGTVLAPAGREIVGLCASWIRNKLDERWRAERSPPFPLRAEQTELRVAPSPAPCSGCAAARTVISNLLAAPTLWREDAESWLKQSHGLDPSEASRRETGDW